MYTIFVGKTVQPEYGIIYNFHYEPVWMLLKRQYVYYCLYSFFHVSDVPFYFWYMFVLAGDAQAFQLLGFACVRLLFNCIFIFNAIYCVNHYMCNITLTSEKNCPFFEV